MFTTTNTNFQSLSKSVGYSKNRTHAFNQYKNEIEMKKRRFHKRDATPSFISNERRLISYTDDSLEPLSSQTLLSGKTSTDTIIEMHSHNKLPPQWVDIYEETVDRLKAINDIQKEIQKLSAKRIKVQFGDHSKLDQQINEQTHKATRILRECEGNVDRISKAGNEYAENESDKKIRKNIQKSLATQISETTLELRKHQKNLYQKIKALDTGSDVGIIDNTGEYMDEDGIQQMEAMDDLARERDESINELIDTINELSHIFKQLNQHVIDQGTLLDRIDFNIEQTVEHTKKAKKELHKAAVRQDNGCAKKCIMILVLLNIIFAFVLFLRFKSARAIRQSYETVPLIVPQGTTNPQGTTVPTSTDNTTVVPNNTNVAPNNTDVHN